MLSKIKSLTYPAFPTPSFKKRNTQKKEIFYFYAFWNFYKDLLIIKINLSFQRIKFLKLTWNNFSNFYENTIEGSLNVGRSIWQKGNELGSYLGVWTEGRTDGRMDCKAHRRRDVHCALLPQIYTLINNMPTTVRLYQNIIFWSYKKVHLDSCYFFLLEINS